MSRDILATLGVWDDDRRPLPRCPRPVDGSAYEADVLPDGAPRPPRRRLTDRVLDALADGQWRTMTWLRGATGSECKHLRAALLELHGDRRLDVVRQAAPKPTLWRRTLR